MGSEATVLQKEIEDAREGLEEDLISLKAKLPKENVWEFEKKEELVKRGFQNDIEAPVNKIESENEVSNLLSSINFLELPFEKNENAAAKVRELREDLEPLYREVQLLHPKSEESFIKSLWWFINLGKAKSLDLLKQIENALPYSSEEILFLINLAQEQINNREIGDLQSFYDFDREELSNVIERMQKNEKEGEFAPLPEIFVPTSIEKAITQLKETKRIIEMVYEGDELSGWLNTPNDEFLGETPKNVILKGKVFRILQYFIRLGEGIT